MRLFPFSLTSSAEALSVSFPFIAGGRPWFGDESNPISCAVSLRSAGEMGYDPQKPNPNRARLFAALGLNAGRVLARVQTHSRDVFAAEAPFAPVFPLPSGDGFATNDPSLVLSVTVADCLPVFLADTETGAAALVHSGWKGTGIALRALQLMGERWGTKPSRVAAVLGPCIRGCCYEVDRDRAEAFDAEFGSVCAGGPLGPAVRRSDSRFFIDLQAANAALLEQAGVSDLAVCQDCTFTDDRLGSFRREGVGHFTRMVALLGRLS